MTDRSDVISLADVTVHPAAGEQPILAGLDLRVEKGSLRVLLGPGGTGKTTLFKVLTGELPVTGGSIQVGSEVIGALRGLKRAKFLQTIGVVFQDVPLLEDRNAAEQVLLPLELSGMSRKRQEEQANRVIERLNLQEVRSLYPHALSMGMRQRVAIARAVAREPLVLLADEPAAHLDAASAREIADIFIRENLRGMTILIGTSDEHFASYFPITSVLRFPDSLIGNKN